jgi:caa(3)-type oxidase subunit IV
VNTLLRNGTTYVWVVLMALTVLSWLLGSDHGLGNSSQSTASLVILGVAVVKIRLVGLHFMELRHAPGYLRGIFEAFCVALFSLLAGMYLFSG